MAIPQAFLDDPLLTAKDIMEIFGEKTGLKRSTVYNHMRFGMKRYKFGRRVFVNLSDF